ncbi:MAG TPA: hypothetical protein PKC45_14070, partial [Gemmatales bacterium]|nr:hypothetical protein [Gemmatales bacterium]
GGEARRLLRSLAKPVRVHVILDAAETLYLDVKNLLENCRTHAADFEIEYVRLTRPDDLERIDNLLKKYGYLGQFGLLVLYDPDGTDVRHQFIKRTADGPDDLGLEDMPRRGFGSSEPPSFRGEQALMSVLRSFVEGQDKLVVYVTQDSGEMSLTDTQVGRPGQFERYDRGLHLLKTNLEKQGYEVKEWNLGAIDENTRQQRPIPADAFAVLIADPAPTIAGKLKPVEDFLRDRKGRLIVLLEPRQGSDGQVEPTGLEELARKQGVNIGTDIVLRVPTNAFPDPTLIIVGVARAADGPLRTAIASQMERRENLIYRARSVSPAEAAPADREVSPLLQTRMILALEDGRMASGHWAETALKGTPTEFLENLAQGEGRRELLQRILGPAVTVAVTVRDKGPLTPSEQPGMPPMPAQGEPRMVFIGDATLASNTQVQSDAEFSYNVLSSSLSWLRGKQVVIGTIKPKERASYRPNLSGDDLSRLRWLPATLLLLFIVAVGVTVGIMRRRAS